MILSEEEAARLIESAATSYHRVIPSRAQLKSALHLQDLPERTLGVMLESVVILWFLRPYPFRLAAYAMPGLVSFDSLKSQLNVVFTQCDLSET